MTKEQGIRQLEALLATDNTFPYNSAPKASTSLLESVSRNSYTSAASKTMADIEPVDRPQSPRTSRRRMLKWVKNSVDALVSIMVLAPLVVGYWRGTFYLLEMYVFPCDAPLVDPPHLYSLIFSLFLGVFGGIFFSYMQDWLMKTICGLESPVSELMWKRLYCYIFGIILVNHWRGVWGLWDFYTGTGWQTGLISFSIGVGLLLIFRCFRNCISPPLVAASDLDDAFFAVQTRFRTPRSKHILFFLDNLFSIAVPGSLIVFVVRGAFILLNNIYPFEVMTFPLYAVTWSVGIGLVILCLLLQKPAANISTSLDKNGQWILKLIFEDIYVFLCLAAGIHVWHSVWGLCDVFIYTHNMELSSWICHAIGVGGLMLMFHGSSILIKGYQIDGEFENGGGCYLPAKSLTIFKVDLGDRPVRRRLQERIAGMRVQNAYEKPAPADAFDSVKYDGVDHTDSPRIYIPPNEQKLLDQLDNGRVPQTARPENFDHV